MTSHLVLGLNQYTHSAAACLLDHTGEVVVALAKERLTRKKHDGGDVAELVGAVMETAGINQEDLSLSFHTATLITSRTTTCSGSILFTPHWNGKQLNSNTARPLLILEICFQTSQGPSYPTTLHMLGPFSLGLRSKRD